MPVQSPLTSTPTNDNIELIRFVGTWSRANRKRIKQAIATVERAHGFGQASSQATPWTVVANAARYYGRRCIAYRHHWSRTFHAATPGALAREIEATIEDPQ